MYGCGSSTQTRASYGFSASYTLLGCNPTPTWDGVLGGGRNVFDANRIQGDYFGARPMVPRVDFGAKLAPVLQWSCDFTLAVRLFSRLGFAISLPELRNVFDFATDKVSTCTS